jgi:hypothetical protein
MLPSRVGARKKRAKRARDPRDPSAFEIQETRQREVPGRPGIRARVTNTTGKSREKAIVIDDKETDELTDTAAQVEARRPPPKISDLLEYSSEAEEASTSEDEIKTALPPRGRKDGEKATAKDLTSRVIYNIETGEATDAEDEIDHLHEVEVEAQPAKKRRRFEDYLDD